MMTPDLLRASCALVGALLVACGPRAAPSSAGSVEKVAAPPATTPAPVAPATPAQNPECVVACIRKLTNELSVQADLEPHIESIRTRSLRCLPECGYPLLRAPMELGDSADIDLLTPSKYQ